jgi:hypothetical protein
MAVTETVPRHVVTSAASRSSAATAIRIVPYTEQERPAVLAFNARMAAESAATDFLLPDRPDEPLDAASEDRRIALSKFIAVDARQEVRGGFLILEQPALVAGRRVTVANYQSPLSEGIRNSRFGMVGMLMLKYLEQHWPFAYVVGMGSPARALPRLLTAAGWSVQPVPFLFHIVHPGRVFRELGRLRRRWFVRTAASAAAASGLAWAGVRLMHARAWPTMLSARGLTIERIDAWGSWADDLWHRAEGEHTFAVDRDRAALDRLYPLAGSPCIGFAVRAGSRTVGWTACLNTPMRDHEHFGNLTVATVLDCVAEPESSAAVVSLVTRELAQMDADLVITNQSHERWIGAFRQAGFLHGPSNYLLAASRQLTTGIGGAFRRVHVTRGDGDGRIHL